jgi:hypothetical protein
MKCPKLIPEVGGRPAALAVSALYLAIVIYVGVGGAIAIDRRRLVLTRDRKALLEGRQAVIAGCVMLGLSATGVTLVVYYVLCFSQW